MHSNPARGKVYLIQHPFIKFVSDLWFSLGTPVSTINRTDGHDIDEILLKVALNTIILTLNLSLEKITVTSHLYSIEDITD